MGKIFLWAGHGEQTNISYAGKVLEIQQLLLLRDRTVAELRSRGYEVFAVPDDLSLSASIQWINCRSLPGDIALALYSTFQQPKTSIFYIAGNSDRKKHAELILLLLVRRLPQLVTQGSKPDTVTEMGNLAFCRQTVIPSLVMTIASFAEDFSPQMATGLADGMNAWSREVANSDSTSYESIDIKLNQQIYSEKGLLINGNACIPIDLCDRLGIDFTQVPGIRLIGYRGVVYLKAIELRDRNISVNWDRLSQTVILRSISPIHRNQIDCLMGGGYTSEVQMIMFLKTHHEKALKDFPDIAKLYQKEGKIEGVNYDIAFCQMCLETNFLRFDGDISPSQNNFANLGTVDDNLQPASFTDIYLGVRSHLQHLKAYASLEPLVQETVDPRFHLVRRGMAEKVSQLSGRWSADLAYGDKIMAMLRQLYESANLL
jgi:hypothetical protein